MKKVYISGTVKEDCAFPSPIPAFPYFSFPYSSLDLKISYRAMKMHF